MQQSSLRRVQPAVVMTRSVLVILFVAVFILYTCEAQRQRCRGGLHDVLMKCGSNCEPSCSRPYTGACNRACAINVCRCQPGFYRRESDQQCVTLDECRSPQYPPHGGPHYPPHGGPHYPPHGGPPYPPHGGPPYPPHGGPPYPPHGGPYYPPHLRPPPNQFGPHGRPPYPPHGRPQPRPYDLLRSD